jgi:hypothetical protein
MYEAEHPASAHRPKARTSWVFVEADGRMFVKAEGDFCPEVKAGSFTRWRKVEHTDPPPTPLIPCPWCGSADVLGASHYDKNVQGGVKRYGFCNSCGATGPPVHVVGCWQKAWNYRVEG